MPTQLSASGVQPRSCPGVPVVTPAGTGAHSGRLIGSNVRLKRLLGQGGMGSVWVADHLGLSTEVAVKFISAEVAEHAEAMGRFQREATAAAQLRSPHVVQVFDHGIAPDGMPFIVMELLEGEDLAKRIERLGPLSVQDVVTIVTQVCKALGKAHAAGIVHRDIKPDNVFLIDSDGDVFVKVLDFGIAKRAEDAALNMTSTGTMVGTPYYMSPEQVLSSKAVDFRCDLWALAVVAYNAITGTLPFVAETLGALCVAISNGSFTPPSQLRPGLPPALDHWFEKALNRDPEQRFDSARQLAEALLRAVGDVRPVLGAVTGVHGQPAADLARPAAAYTPAPYAAPQPETLHGASLPTGAPRRRAALIVAAVGAAALLFGALATVLVVSSGTKPDASAEPVQASVPVVEPVAASPARSASPQRDEAPPPVVEPSPKPVATAQKPAPAPAPAAVRRPPTTAPKRPPASKPPATGTATSKKEADRYGF